MYSLTYIEIYPYLIFYPLFILFVYNQFWEVTAKRRVWLLLVVYVHLAFLAVLSVHWAWTTLRSPPADELVKHLPTAPAYK